MQSFNEAFKGLAVNNAWTSTASKPFDAQPGAQDAAPATATAARAPAAAESLGDIAGGAAGLLDRLNQLQSELAREREARQGRAALLQKLDSQSRCLREELQEERCLLEKAEDHRTVHDARADDAERALEELQERQHGLLSRRATLEAEIRRHSVAAWTEELSRRQAAKDREWARDGPETEALKCAKVDLAETLGMLDEARMHSRKGLAKLQREVENVGAENLALQHSCANAAAAPAPFSLRQSVWQLLTSGARRDEFAEQSVRPPA